MNIEAPQNKYIGRSFGWKNFAHVQSGFDLTFQKWFVSFPNENS